MARRSPFDTLREDPFLCGSGKVEYATLRGAAEAAVEQLALGRVQRPYACDLCDRYHLTSQPLGREGTITTEMVLTLAKAVGAREAS